MTNDDLLNIFREEVTDHLAGLNDALLKVEMSQGDEKAALLREMNRLAHSMKGAARAVGYGLIETVSHYMEEVFHAALNKGMALTPEVADSLYDGLDLIQNVLDGAENNPDVVAKVTANLEKVVTSHNNGDIVGKKPKKKTKKPDKHITEDSDEMPAIRMPAPGQPSPEAAAPGGDSAPGPSLLHKESHLTPPPSSLRREESKPRTFSTPQETNSELMQIFRGEMEEHLAALNDAMLQVEMMPTEERPQVLREMNRIAHSMKGAARAVGYGLIETLSHYMEEVFHAALHKELALSPEIADALYDGLDLLQNTMQAIEVEPGVIDTVLTALEQIAPAAPHETRQSHPVRPPENPLSPLPEAVKRGDKTPPLPAMDNVELPPVHSSVLTPETGLSTVERTVEVSGVPRPASVPDISGTSSTMILRPPEESIRVAVSKLDSLMAESSELLVARMQGELHHQTVMDLRRELARWRREWRSVRTAYIRLARRLQEQGKDSDAELNILFKFLQSNEDYLTNAGRKLAGLSQTLVQDNMHLATLSDALQTIVSDLRMMPFDTIVGGFQRMVRDLARDTGKQVHLDVVGANVEIDKTVLDALKDPLLHLLRNAIDHGIETPAMREASGKSPVGHVSLIVEQRGTEIVIKVQDDGHGINVSKIRRKAVLVGLLTEAEAEALSDEDARMLIFQSGFSTSDAITAISGRGLGMDIVRDRVESLRGRVSVQSVVGHGTLMIITVPVSLTRIRAVLLRVGEEDYAIPSTMILRMQTLTPGDIFTAEGREMVMINNRPMPLVNLGAMLDIPGAASRGDTMTIVALQSADKAVAFEVDRLHSEIELVLKPLGRELESTPCVAGAALLGSGEVIIILDANDLVRKASGSMLPLRRGSYPTAVRPEARRLRVLVVDDSITTRTLEKNILEAVGFEVFVAIDGAEAWDMLLETSPDVVISDVEMPNMNGLELTRRVKNNPHTQDIPMILLTSLSKPEQREEGLRAGADAYLVKSRFDQGELLETIRSVI